ncbi:MAG: RNA polymerase-associated protein RapA [Bryobacteraceae bacterium]|nr:RNA polymerase-associated protein RapA [Bryobacteraceae bacterium]
MYLQRFLSQSFHSSTRAAGDALFSGGRVRILSGNQWSVEAVVRDPDERKVKLHREGDRVTPSCDCQRSGKDRLCKHMWAGVLAADSKSYLLGRMGGTPYISQMEDDGDDELNVREAPRRRASIEPRGKLQKPAPPPPPAWHILLSNIHAMTHPGSQVAEHWPSGREIYYILERRTCLATGRFYVAIEVRDPASGGRPGKLKPHKIYRANVALLPQREEREILAVLFGTSQSSYGWAYEPVPSGCYLTPPLSDSVIPRLCASGRFLLRKDNSDLAEEMPVLEWDCGPLWEFSLRIDREGEHYKMRGSLSRDSETCSVEDPDILFSDGLMLYRNRIARYEHHGAFSWAQTLRKEKQIVIPVSQGQRFLEEFVKLPRPRRVLLPEELRYEDVRVAPRPRLLISPPTLRSYAYRAQSSSKLRGELSFDYDGKTFQPSDKSGGSYDAEAKRYVHRDPEAEKAAMELLAEIGVKRITYSYYQSGTVWEVSSRKLPTVARELIRKGWHVEAEGKMFRKPESFHAELTSGIDWFELHGAVDFGGGNVPLPQLIKSVQKGEGMVLLDDGSYGLLPEGLLSRYGTLFQFGKAEGDHLRYSKSQTGLLDVFLAEREEIKVDETFQRARERLRSFDGIRPRQQPAGFQGELRGYQCEGLGWMEFLAQLGWGGCLADDMGVGKTAQVLALIEYRRQQGAGPSLVVVPRSLIYNWKNEAARFTPHLAVLDHSVANRSRDAAVFSQYNLVLTTYGLLRRDVLDFKDFVFDYAILDEAQAIKNSSSESAKAARLLTANHRLTLSGTPIENHLGELWSLFEFLNPGMLGGASALQGTSSALRNPGEETRRLLARAVRPFILRRTKEQVARELPEKSEQTIYCELDPPQRKLYDELRDYYRVSLLGRIERNGFRRSKIQILEALLRLRQAACHPGLIDKKHAGESSAKLDTLLPQLEEVLSEGHKALVFSQFTSMLAILRGHLDSKKTTYEYLDGSTRDRQSHVERFQDDPDCKLFLISLKAGGLGLNLTAADYVFLLDPWWNPAVEMQAIDRTHRIGQTRPVFAYRLIARDTVEEKVLELQSSKKDLAEAIITESNGFLAGLQREDLELLLS